MEENNLEDTRKKILIVDDEKPIVDLLIYNLARDGYEFIEAYDGEKAVELAIEKKPDLILLDVMLPKMDGLAVCKKIKNIMNGCSNNYDISQGRRNR